MNFRADLFLSHPFSFVSYSSELVSSREYIFLVFARLAIIINTLWQILYRWQYIMRLESFLLSTAILAGLQGVTNEQHQSCWSKLWRSSSRRKPTSAECRYGAIKKPRRAQRTRTSLGRWRSSWSNSCDKMPTWCCNLHLVYFVSFYWEISGFLHHE